MSVIETEPGCHPVLAAVGAARGLLDTIRDHPLWTVPDAALPDAVAATLGLVAQAQALLVGLVGEVDARAVATATGAPTTTAWLRDRHKIAPVEAYKLVKTAAALRAGLPLTRAALASGEITLAHAHGIVRAAADLPADLPASLAKSVEARMVRDARNFDPIIAGRLARHVLSLVVRMTSPFGPTVLGQVPGIVATPEVVGSCDGAWSAGSGTADNEASGVRSADRAGCPERGGVPARGCKSADREALATRPHNHQQQRPAVALSACDQHAEGGNLGAVLVRG